MSAPFAHSAPAALLLQAAHAACAQQNHPPAALYMVASPIGNLADVSLRAIHVLSLVDAVACEDTRVAARLLSHLGLHKPLLSLHAHNEREATPVLLARLGAGERIAFVSDAGTPGVCDPGAWLAQAARAAGHPVLALPGPSSVAAALSVAGDAADDASHVFMGFLSAKAGERAAQIAAMAADARRSLALETPHRLAKTLGELAAACPDRPLTVCRELSKQFEQTVTLHCAEAPGWLAATPDHGRGEFVLLLHAAPRQAPAPGEADAAANPWLAALLPHLPLKTAVAVVAQVSGAPRKALYTQALALKDAGESPA